MCGATRPGMGPKVESSGTSVRVSNRCNQRIIAFITAPRTVRQMLEHRGEPTRPPRFAPARGPPLWAVVTAVPPADNASRWEELAQPLPQIEFAQRLTW